MSYSLPHKATFLDYSVVSLLILLAAIPFHQVFHLNLGFAIFNMGELLLLSLFFVFILTIAFRGIVKDYAVYVLMVFAIFLLYICFSLLFRDEKFFNLTGQTRNFLPFIVACTALLCRLNIDKNKLLQKIVYSTTLSAIIAIVIHFFFKNFIAYAFSASEEVTSIILNGGRMYWGGASLSLFAFSAFLLERKKQQKMVFMVLILIVFFACLLTQSRTMLVGLIFFYMATEIFVFKKKIRPILKISALAMSAVFLFIIIAPDNSVNLLQRRFFLNNHAQAELEHSLTIGRFFLYMQYLNILQTTFPFGQGLGLPYAISRLGDSVYTTDISLLSFVLPFGVCGLVIFIVFFVKILNSLKKYSRVYKFKKSGGIFYWLTVSAFLISLNLDLFSRNSFVVYLAVFVALLNSSRQIKVRQIYIAQLMEK